MSALDLFASALGAFIIISIILFPYFTNTSNSNIEGVRRANNEMRARIAELERENARGATCLQELERARQATSTCEAQLQQTFLLVVISWGTADDIDLHVTDPQGREFYFRTKRHRGSDAALEEDNTRGPGNEIWLDATAGAGTYKIEYVLFAKKQVGTTAVRGAFISKFGRTSLPGRALTQRSQRVTAAYIVVGSDGTARIR